MGRPDCDPADGANTETVGNGRPAPGRPSIMVPPYRWGASGSWLARISSALPCPATRRSPMSRMRSRTFSVDMIRRSPSGSSSTRTEQPGAVAVALELPRDRDDVAIADTTNLDDLHGPSIHADSRRARRCADAAIVERHRTARSLMSGASNQRRARPLRPGRSDRAANAMDLEIILG